MKTLLRILSLTALLAFAPQIPAAETGTKTAPAAKAKGAAKVDINTADAQALQALPGVGPATAQAIIAARPFASVDDLERVQGIGPAKMAELKPLVRASHAGEKGGKGKGDAKKSERAKEKAKSTSSQTKIDVNTADTAALEQLPGVGPTTARAIVAARPFKSVDDLERVPGIGAAKLEELRDRVTVSRRTAEKTIGAAPRTERERALEPTGRPSVGTRDAGVAASGRVNLNTASRAELEALPEIGPVKAQAIIDARPFSSIEDVMRVKGIKEGTFDAIRDRITVGRESR